MADNQGYLGETEAYREKEPVDEEKGPIRENSTTDGTVVHVPDIEQRQSKSQTLLYSLEDIPSWYMCIVLGCQQYMTMIGATVIVPLSLFPYLCVAEDDPVRGSIICTIIFVSGLVTFFQSTFGIRLPIVQGGTFGILVPTIVILKSSYIACDKIDFSSMTDEERTELWQVRMRNVQGAIIIASLFQICVGLSGFVGQLLKWITPLAITPTITLIGLSLFSVASDMAGSHWGIAVFTMVLTILFSQYLRNVKTPVPYYSKTKGFTVAWISSFNLFPIILSILISWVFCAILTVTDALPADSVARTTSNIDIISRAPWFRVPYPFQWGVPTIAASSVLGILSGIIASILESIGDYYACARLCDAPPPTVHAINRAIFMEGIGCMLAGLWGSGNGTTSYSENIGSIGVTKVASRRVIQYGSVIMVLCGVIGKFGALFVTIPTPVIGAIFCIMFSIISSVGLSTLQHVNLNSPRNLFILGFSIFMGLVTADWVKKEENIKLINTGSETFDQIIAVLLETSMFIGGVIGFILDNTVPGTDEERGLVKWREMNNLNKNKSEEAENNEDQPQYSPYDFPIGMDFLRRQNWTKYIPISPTFEGWEWLAIKIKNLTNKLKKKK